MAGMPVKFELEAEIDDQEFLMLGDGTGDSSEGCCDLSIEIGDHPEGFDPISCPLICHQQTSLAFAESTDAGSDIVGLADGEYEVAPDRTGIIRDGDGEKLAQIEVTGSVTREDGTLVSTQTMTGTSDLPALEGIVTPVQDYILPAGPGEATGLTRYELETEDGERLEAITVVPYRWDNEKELSAPIHREVDVDADWDGESMLDVEYDITMSSLEEDADAVQPFAATAPTPSDD